MKLLKRTTALVVVALVLGTAGCTKPSNDAAITDRVKTAISNAPELKGTKVSVSTHEKVVQLGGTVKSRAERAMLIAVARKVEGVKAVKTDLVVQPQPKTVAQPRSKSKPKTTAQAQAKQKPKTQQRVTQRVGEYPGTGR